MADNTVNDDDKPDTKTQENGGRPSGSANAGTKNDEAAKPKPRTSAAKAPPRRAAPKPSRPAGNDDDRPKPAARKTQAKQPPKPKPDDSSDNSDKVEDNVLRSGTFWGAAALGMGLGVALMLGRKVAVQAPTILAGDWDKALALEHRAVEKLFDLMAATTNKNTTKRSVLLMQLKHALAKHALQEENAVYPALRDSGMVDGADELNREHGYVKQYLYELDNCPKDSDEFLQIVQRFRADIDHHVREEEEVLYPRMKAQLGEAANDRLTTAMNKEGFKLA